MRVERRKKDEPARKRESWRRERGEVRGVGRVYCGCAERAESSAADIFGRIGGLVVVVWW